MRIITILLAILSLLTGCQSKVDNQNSFNNKKTGKWKMKKPQSNNCFSPIVMP